MSDRDRAWAGHPSYSRHRHDGRKGRGSCGGGSGKRYFGRGGVKYALLELLTKEPMHGYQMMKGLEEQSGGLYSPSAGSIYPTLQLLEDRDFVTAAEDGGKKVYRITEQGQAFLQEGRESASDRGWFGEWTEFDKAAGSEQIREQRAEMAVIIRLLARAEKEALRNPDHLELFRQLIANLRQQLEDYHHSINN